MPIRNYDNTLVGGYIRALENPDSTGFKNGRWYQSTRKVDDPNSRGFGIDVTTNKKATEITKGRKGKWLTEQEERNLRNSSVNYAENILEKHWGNANASEGKRAMAIGMVYRGDGPSIWNNSALKNAYYNGSDEDFQRAVSNFYNIKGRHYQPERARNHNTFMNSQRQGKRQIAIPKIKLPAIVEQPDATRVARRYADGGELSQPRLWDGLSLREMSDVMAVAVRHGVTSLKDIRQKWNEFADGGNLYKGGGKVSQRNQRAGYAVDYFVNKGLSREQAAGLVGNLMRESGMNTSAVNPASGAYGIGQWLGGRKAKLFKKYGKNPTFDNQLDYVWDELNSTHKKGLQMLKSSKTVDDAARNAFGYYEFSAGPQGAVAAMNRWGQNGMGALNTGINYAHSIYGSSHGKGNPSVYEKSRFALPANTAQDIDFLGMADVQLPGNYNSADTPQAVFPSNPTDYGTPIDWNEVFARPAVQEGGTAMEEKDNGMGLLSLMRNMGVFEEPEQQPLATYTPQKKSVSPFVVQAPVYNDTLLDDSWFAKGGALYDEGGRMFLTGGNTDVPPSTDDPDYYLKQALSNGTLMTKTVADPSRGEIAVHPDDVATSTTEFGTELNDSDMTALSEYAPSDEEEVQDEMDRRLSDYLTASNDATAIGSPSNSYLQQRGLEGAMAHAAREQYLSNHPWANLLDKGMNYGIPALMAAPFAVTMGDAAAATSLGQKAYTGLSTIANAAKNSTWLPWTDAASTSYFGANGINDAINGNFTPESTLEVMPLGQLGKPLIRATQEGVRYTGRLGSSDDITENVLRWLGKPSDYSPKTPLSTIFENKNASARDLKLAQLWRDNGVDLSKVGIEDLPQIYAQRMDEIMSTHPERYTVVNPAYGGDFYSMNDYAGDRQVGSASISLDNNNNATMEDINNLTEDRRKGIPASVHGVQERGLNAAINVAHSEGGEGVITGKQYESAPKQYHIAQKYHNRKQVGNNGFHSNTNMVEEYNNAHHIVNDEDEPATSMLDLANAGDRSRKTLLNAPVWLLKSPTFFTPTKATVFNPTIIDKLGKMHIDWSNPNVFRSIFYPTFFDLRFNLLQNSDNSSDEFK